MIVVKVTVATLARKMTVDALGDRRLEARCAGCRIHRFERYALSNVVEALPLEAAIAAVAKRR
jgi:hypothetical protein